MDLWRSTPARPAYYSIISVMLGLLSSTSSSSPSLLLSSSSSSYPYSYNGFLKERSSQAYCLYIISWPPCDVYLLYDLNMYIYLIIQCVFGPPYDVLTLTLTLTLTITHSYNGSLKEHSCQAGLLLYRVSHAGPRYVTSPHSTYV
jgi:hypothetical protein